MTEIKLGNGPILSAHYNILKTRENTDACIVFVWVVLVSPKILADDIGNMEMNQKSIKGKAKLKLFLRCPLILKESQKQKHTHKKKQEI